MNENRELSFSKEDEQRIAAYIEKVKYADLVEDIKFREMFPNLSKTKEKFNNMMEGEKHMSGLTREIYIDGYESGEKKGIQQGIEQGMFKAFTEMVKDKILTASEAAKRLGVSESDFLKMASV